MTDQCRMTTINGKRCLREPAEAAMGLCWQHIPSSHRKKRKSWKQRLEVAALVVSGAEILIDIIELAVKHCAEFFGDGDHQTMAKNEIIAELSIRPFFPQSADDDSYNPGARVDWKLLLDITRMAKQAQVEPNAERLSEMQLTFDFWFSSLSASHRSRLLRAIEAASI